MGGRKCSIDSARCAVRDLSVNVARIARTMELLEKPTTAYREGAEHDNKEE